MYLMISSIWIFFNEICNMLMSSVMCKNDFVIAVNLLYLSSLYAMNFKKDFIYKDFAGP